MTGILITDFWIVRRQHWKIPDLFREDGVYWYTWGLNWRAFVCFFLGCIPSMRKFSTLFSLVSTFRTQRNPLSYHPNTRKIPHERKKKLILFLLTAGFVCTVNGDPIAIGWTRIYQLSYFVGLAISCPGYWLLCRLFPPPALRVMEYMDDEVDSDSGGDNDSHQDQRGVTASDPASDDGSGVMVERKTDGVSSSEKDLGTRVGV